MDELIDQELVGLRAPIDSPRSLGDSILAMQAVPRRKWLASLKWPLGLGSVAAVVIAVIFFGSLMTSQAYAADLRAADLAQKSQKTRHQKSIIFGNDDKPALIMDFWSDHGKEAYRQARPNGQLDVAEVNDGVRSFHYISPALSSSKTPWASIDEDRSDHFDIETLGSILSSKSFKTLKIEKKAGIKLDGRLCDYYSIGKGYYRLWVDTTTKLPVQREIWDRGVSIWKRDTYDYPAVFPAATFKPYKLDQVQYCDYFTTRTRLRAMLAGPGQSQPVGNVTISLKAVVKDGTQIRAIWTTNGTERIKKVGDSSLEIPYARKDSAVDDIDVSWLAPGRKVVCGGLSMNKPLQAPLRVRIAAWEVDGHGGMKFVGWTTFTAKEIMTTTSNSQLLRERTNKIEHAKVSKAKI